MSPELIKAMSMVIDEHFTPYKAALICNVHSSTLHRALKRDNKICPTCGGVVETRGRFKGKRHNENGY